MLLLNFLFVLSLATQAMAGNWVRDAARLTGESDFVRQKALKRLQQDKGLIAKLEPALESEQRAQALDVISALQLHQLLPALKKQASKDEDGAVFLAMNQLIDEKNSEETLKFYHDKLFCDCVSVPAQVVILDTLARIGYKLSASEINRLQQNENPEIQSSALEYIRFAFLRKQTEFKPFLRKAAKSDFWQQRLQALYLYSELPADQREGSISPKDFKDDPTKHSASLRVHIAFGYKDARPARFVGDRYERLALIQNLLKACPRGGQVCGFKRNPHDSDLLQKTLSNGKTIDLSVTLSSAGADDEMNRRNPYQDKLSELAQERFTSALQEDDAVIYVGHSRDGGGPDFAIPKITSSHHVDYAYYKKNKPGVQLMKSSHAKTHLLALISCASTKEFTKKALKLPTQTRLVTVPDLLYYSDGLTLVQKILSEIFQAQQLTAAAR